MMQYNYIYSCGDKYCLPVAVQEGPGLAQVPATRQTDPWHVTACPQAASLEGYTNSESEFKVL